MRRLRLWRVRHAYRVIQKLELRVGDEALDLRSKFTTDTFKLIDGASRRAGHPRGSRRRIRRQLMNTTGGPR